MPPSSDQPRKLTPPRQLIELARRGAADWQERAAAFEPVTLLNALDLAGDEATQNGLLQLGRAWKQSGRLEGDLLEEFTLLSHCIETARRQRQASAPGGFESFPNGNDDTTPRNRFSFLAPRPTVTVAPALSILNADGPLRTAEGLSYFMQKRPLLEEICLESGVAGCHVLPEASGAHTGNHLVLQIIPTPNGAIEEQTRDFTAAVERSFGADLAAQGIASRITSMNHVEAAQELYQLPPPSQSARLGM